MRWKLRGRLAGLRLLSLSFITANAGYSVGPARADVSDPTVGYRTVTNKMYAARSAAQQHLEVVIGESEAFRQLPAKRSQAFEDRGALGQALLPAER